MLYWQWFLWVSPPVFSGLRVAIGVVLVDVGSSSSFDVCGVLPCECLSDFYRF